MTATTSDLTSGAAADAPRRTRRWPPLWWRRFRKLPRPLRVSAYVAVLVVLVLVAATLTGGRRGAAFVPADERRDRGAGPVREGRRAARRPRHPAGLRGHDRGPHVRPGVRARPGAVLRDGRAAPRHGRPPGRAVRRDRRRDRHVRPHDGLAPGRGGRAAAARPRHPGRARRLRGRRQRVPRGPVAERDRPRVRLPRHGGSTAPRSRGRPSTPSPGSRRWRGTCAATCTRRSTGRLPARWWGGSGPRSCTPPTPTREHPIVGAGRRRRRRLRAGRQPGDTRQPTGPRPSRPDPSPAPRSRPGSGGCPPGSVAATGSAATPGSSRASTPTPGLPLLANDPHLGVSLRGSGSRSGSTAATSARPAPRRRRVLLRRGARA